MPCKMEAYQMKFEAIGKLLGITDRNDLISFRSESVTSDMITNLYETLQQWGYKLINLEENVLKGLLANRGWEVKPGGGLQVGCVIVERTQGGIEVLASKQILLGVLLPMSIILSPDGVMAESASAKNAKVTLRQIINNVVYNEDMYYAATKREILDC